MTRFVAAAGVVLFALGSRETLGAARHPLQLIPAVALCGGVALYFVGDVAFRRRCLGTISRPRLLAGAACTAWLPAATVVPALAALAGVALACSALVTYETRRPAGRVSALSF